VFTSTEPAKPKRGGAPSKTDATTSEAFPEPPASEEATKFGVLPEEVAVKYEKPEKDSGRGGRGRGRRGRRARN
jgi:hypothetical protein